MSKPRTSRSADGLSEKKTTAKREQPGAMSKPRTRRSGDGVSSHRHGDGPMPVGDTSPTSVPRASLSGTVKPRYRGGEKSTSLSSQSSGTSPNDKSPSYSSPGNARSGSSPVRRPSNSPRGIGSVRPAQRPSPVTAGQDTETLNVNFHAACLVCVFVALCVVGVFFYPWVESSPDVETVENKRSQREVMVETFDKEIRSLQEMFPAQEPRFWRVIKASTKRVLRQSDPSQPAILLLASDTAGESTLNCLTIKLTSVISKTYDATEPFAEYRPNSSSSLSKEKGKIDLDDTLRNGFQRGSKVAVVRNLERISGKIAMMLHAYCDNENAPYKDVALLLTSHVRPSDNEDARMPLMDKEVEAYLTDAWNSDLDVDSLSALLSRVANNIAVVIPESESSLKNC